MADVLGGFFLDLLVDQIEIGERQLLVCHCFE
jgi:hypothetical protein